MQGAGNPGTSERLALAVALTQGHEAGHLMLGKTKLVAASLSKAQVGHLVIKRHQGLQVAQEVW